MTYKKIVLIAGPTAVGKTALSIKLARAFSGEIISCDSMQLYRGMDIGTAKPTPKEQDGIKHHLIDILDIGDSFSVVDYVRSAELCIENIYSKNKVPFFCGGTGLYIDSVVNSTKFGDIDTLPAYRDELSALAKEKGTEHIHEMLQKVDPEAAEKIDHRNLKRVIRALEVYKVTGMTISSFQRMSELQPKKFDSLEIVLEYRDREKLYDRINKRVDMMVDDGLVDEAKALLEKGLLSCKTAGQAIGYKELSPYFDGTASLDECIEKIKQESRRYAKRQLTWFRRCESAARLYADEMSAEELFCEAKRICSEFLVPEQIWSV